ncbi:hypothetical protein [Nocardia sp. MH4]|uniref:hypothetical protein n=1 Tax=Nocardia sp. MH4 TaxID=1768677 RepID=UPI001C4E9189|nr:hypothetical protein [Nocardia sp. MH4]
MSRQLMRQLSNLPNNIQSAISDAAETMIVRYALCNGDEIIRLGNLFADSVKKLWESFVEQLKGIAAPGFFISTSFGWTDFTKEANTMASDLESTAVKVDSYWQGTAATAYGAVITPQRTATARVGTIANAARSAMITVGTAGVAFYASLLGVCISVIVEAMMEVGAAGTGVGAIPAAIAGLVTAAKFAAMVTAIITGMVAIINSAVTQAQALQVELDNPQGFPDGH